MTQNEIVERAVARIANTALSELMDLQRDGSLWAAFRHHVRQALGAYDAESYSVDLVAALRQIGNTCVVTDAHRIAREALSLLPGRGKEREQ